MCRPSNEAAVGAFRRWRSLLQNALPLPSAGEEAFGVTVCFWMPSRKIKMKHYSEVFPSKEAGGSEFESQSCHLRADGIGHVPESSGALASL